MDRTPLSRQQLQQLSAAIVEEDTKFIEAALRWVRPFEEGRLKFLRAALDPRPSRGIGAVIERRNRRIAELIAERTGADIETTKLEAVALAGQLLCLR